MGTGHESPRLKIEDRDNFQNGSNSHLFQHGKVSMSAKFHAFITMCTVHFIIRRTNEFSSSKVKINHLLYMDDLKLYGKTQKDLESLIQTVRIYSSDIGMEFGLEKCASLVMKRGKVAESDGITLPDDRTIKNLYI